MSKTNATREPSPKGLGPDGLRSPSVGWVLPKCLADMPEKPGKEAYEYVECLVLHRGEVKMRPWNCEHQVFDDEEQDDFYCEWHEVGAYLDLTDILAALAPIKAGTGETACGLGAKHESGNSSKPLGRDHD